MMIVKVQISQFSSDGTVNMLIYDESRKHRFEGEATQEVLNIMDGQSKQYFQAKLLPDLNKKGAFRFQILSKAPWQKW